MNVQTDNINERLAAIAFSRQSATFDEQYAQNTIIQYKRERVRKHLQQLLHPNSYVLELNAGTGDDAIWLAQNGHRVHATDIAEGMQRKLSEKVAYRGLTGSITNEICSFTEVHSLKDRGPYDAIFSNFAGLNCTGNLKQVLYSFEKLLKPGGTVVLVILPPFCIWESLLILKGKFKTATRRFFSSKGRTARVEGSSFKCWYYSPGYVVRHLKDQFDLLHIEGLCTFVPPSYIENFAQKHPIAYKRLCRMESTLKDKWPWKNIGDYYIISLRRKQ
jgi:ubiquinone/menaquinone biosynthesis C-methylase UbiE